MIIFSQSHLAKVLILFNAPYASLTSIYNTSLIEFQIRSFVYFWYINYLPAHLPSSAQSQLLICLFFLSRVVSSPLDINRKSPASIFLSLYIHVNHACGSTRFDEISDSTFFLLFFFTCPEETFEHFTCSSYSSSYSSLSTAQSTDERAKILCFFYLPIPVSSLLRCTYFYRPAARSLLYRDCGHFAFSFCLRLTRPST